MRLILAPILIILVFIYCLFVELAFVIPSAINETKDICRRAVDMTNKKKSEASKQ